MNRHLLALVIGLAFSANTFAQSCWDSLPGPFFNFSDDSVGICIGGSSNFEISPPLFQSYQWSTGETTPIINIDSLGVFWVTVSLDTCVWYSDTVNTFFHPQPQPYIVANGPTEFCHGESVQLCIEPGPWASVLWNSGATTQCIAATDSFTYCAMVLDGNGCLDTIDNCLPVTVYNPQPEILFQGNNLICTPTFATYQWFYIGSPIPGESNSNCQSCVIGCGNYGITVANMQGCTATNNVEYCPPSIAEFSIIEQFKLYPNPTSGEISLELQLKSAAEVKLSVRDILGQNVQEWVLNPQTQFRTILDIQALSKGVYLIYLQIGEESIMRKLVKE